MKELVKTCPEIPPAVTRQREERAEYVQTIVDCGKKLKQQMTGEKQEKKDEERVDSGITVAIDILQLQRNQVLHYNLRRKRRICRLLHDIQMEISVAVHEVSRDQELDEEMLQFEEEQQQLQEVQGDTSVWMTYSYDTIITQITSDTMIRLILNHSDKLLLHDSLFPHDTP